MKKYRLCHTNYLDYFFLVGELGVIGVAGEYVYRYKILPLPNYPELDNITREKKVIHTEL